MDKQSHNFSLEETMVLSNCQWSFLPQVPDRWISGTATTRAWATWARSIRSIGSITWRDDFVVLKRMNTFVWEPSSASHFSLKPLQNSQIKSSNQSRDQEISWKFIQWIGCRMGRIVLFLWETIWNNLAKPNSLLRSIVHIVENSRFWSICSSSLRINIPSFGQKEASAVALRVSCFELEGKSKGQEPSWLHVLWPNESFARFGPS